MASTPFPYPQLNTALASLRISNSVMVCIRRNQNKIQEDNANGLRLSVRPLLFRRPLSFRRCLCSAPFLCPFLVAFPHPLEHVLQIAVHTTAMLHLVLISLRRRLTVSAAARALCAHCLPVTQSSVKTGVRVAAATRRAAQRLLPIVVDSDDVVSNAADRIYALAKRAPLA